MMITLGVCRRLSPRTFVFSAVVLTILLCIYYASYTSYMDKKGNDSPAGHQPFKRSDGHERTIHGLGANHATCPNLAPSSADVDTVQVFKKLDFQPSWMKNKEYWDKTMEDRYERLKQNPKRPPLKVIIVPHSHNDPGWLNTFEHYFHYQSSPIINNALAKLQQYSNMTFIWSEVAFLDLWWEEAHPTKRRALKALAESKRLEITTGGWVMTDEANAHIYAMVDQMIEGHQWLKSNLGIKPKSGWSVDPFGHGSTQPHLLALSGITGTVIQRIHYAWKQWFASRQFGDFIWVPLWAPSNSQLSILTHNQPFDIYSIKHSCGPHPYVCLSFDFRKVPGEYTEYSVKAQTITDKNVREKSELLLEQYARAASLYPHNVALVPLGDDFRYNFAEEFDQQYINYMKLIEYINSNKDKYNAEVSFGTPSDYFSEIMKRYQQYPTLKGDFFVYSDIFSEGRPAYWSGYFTTRPFMKILARELEASLRGAEILYTIALNKSRQQKLSTHLKILERAYERLVESRRNLALFQHHDAITGTSKAFVMRDYGLKLFESIRNSMVIQQDSLHSLLFPHTPFEPNVNIILNDVERENFEKLPKKTPILIVGNQTRKIILYNSLAHRQDYLVQLRVNDSNIKVLGYDGVEIMYQINPVWDTSEGTMKLSMAVDEFELVFIAHLPPLSLAHYTIVPVPVVSDVSSKMSTIYCNNCKVTKTTTPVPNILKGFKLKNIPPGDIQLENGKFRILFNGNTGFMKSMTRKHNQKVMQCGIHFGAYKSAQFHSGAYLFMPDPNEREIEKDVLQQYKDQVNVIITSGPVSSELTVMYGPFLMHTVAIYHVDNSSLSDGIYIENIIDFEKPPKNRETELFMRILSEVQNGDPPEFYSDLNGFQMQKRVKVERIGIEGNYYPITTMAYIEDNNVRLSLLTNHAQGAASWQPGQLELMLDRRSLYDDARGMGEGIVDNRKTLHRHWLLVEDLNSASRTPSPQKVVPDADIFESGDVLRTFNIPTPGSPAASEDNSQGSFSRPSLYANRMSLQLNYPVGIFVVDPEHQDQLQRFRMVGLLDKKLPCDIHLMNLRTQSDVLYKQFPSPSALMVLHRQGYDCGFRDPDNACHRGRGKDENIAFNHLFVKSIDVTSLTGMETLQENITRLSDIQIESMSLKTLNITFI